MRPQFTLLFLCGLLTRCSSIPYTGPAFQENSYVGDSVVRHVVDDDMTAPSEFFSGALQRPLLQILRPENGEVLESGEVEIVVDVSGYDLPSKLHDSRVCLGIASQGKRILETCFEQSPKMEYVVSGLSPGQSYMLRVVLFERSNALAVSVRSFRVGAVSIYSDDLDGAGGHPMVTIQTALELAVQHHNLGKHLAAEHIYRQIIQEHPDHPDALHLLGLVLYQKGDPGGAISYIERAIHTNSTFEVFHNSLGECLRAVGRVGDAIKQFNQALKIRPDFISAKFNMGLAYQQMNDWSKAVKLYEDVLDIHLHRSLPSQFQVESQILLEARTRQCDLLQALGDFTMAQECWENGLRQYPSSALMYNELGNLHVQIDNLELATEYYESALHYGIDLAELNIAIVLELMGRTSESVERYEKVLATTRAKGLPDIHIMIKMATVLPRVMPESSELIRFRRRFEEKLDELLLNGLDFTDNSEPTKSGFSLGFHLGFHGENNAALKSKLHRIYSQFCPSLLTGHFISEDNIILQNHLAVINPGKNVPPALSPIRQSDNNPLLVPMPQSEQAQFGFNRPIRVGFISRFFYNHAIGILTQGVIMMLPRSKFHITVFMIEPPPTEDHVSSHIHHHADQVFILPGELNLCADVVRNQKLDALVYPEIGMDPVSYFLAFARLAPVQAAWWGHPDTTGISSIDYFISSDVEIPTADKHYSERLYRMKGLGAYFIRPSVEDVNRASLRSRIQQDMNLPSNVHFYLCPQALFKFHPTFDDILVEILAKDKLAYLLLLNGRERHAWSKMLLSRVQAKMKEDQTHRVLFYTVSGDQEMLSLYLLSDVVLDTYPSGGYINSLQAFAVGAPVITWPGQYLNGRLTLAMYEKMGIPHDCCVASDAKDYVTLALQMTHNKPYRSRIVSRILASNYRLFEDPGALVEWETFFMTSLSRRGGGGGRRDILPAEANHNSTSNNTPSLKGASKVPNLEFVGIENATTAPVGEGIDEEHVIESSWEMLGLTI